MIDATAPTQPTAPTRPDPVYQSWQGSMQRATMRFDLNDRTAGPIPTFGSMIHETALAAQSRAAYAPASADSASAKPDIAYPAGNADDEFSFGDVIDMINPLQHLPIVGMVYRKLTGDTIKPMSDIIGGAIFGGPVGAVVSTVNAIVKTETGKDVAENAFAAIGFDIAPEGAKKPDLVYANTQLVNTGIAEAVVPTPAPASQIAAYQTASDGRKNFSGSSIFTQSWNA